MFAALSVLDGRVIGRNMQRHRHQEFIRFLNAVEAAVPTGMVDPVASRDDRIASVAHATVRFCNSDPLMGQLPEKLN